ncbi:hypothetical protein ACFOW4_05900 [Micromonospora sp. GCM10011542]|uniref:hypothetical protein n=1 Tax=Micromonospora sp. GCM10011542 TaxID=3317337 RepID=UPI00360CA7B7
MIEWSPRDSSTRGRWRGPARAALRWGLPLLWLLWAGLAWWTEPRQVPEEQLDRDLAAGSVVTFQRTTGWDDSDAYWGSRAQPRYATAGDTIAWTLPNGQIRYAYVGTPDPTWSGTDPTDLDPSAPASTAPDPATSPSEEATADPEPAPVEPEDARLVAVADPWGTAGAPAHRAANAAGLLAAVVTLLWLGVLVAGAPPTAGTRWFWFWVGLLPFGLGVLAWTYRERWRPRHPTGAAVRPGAGTIADTRSSGWRGLGWLFVGGIAISLLVYGASLLLGPTVVPG